MVSATRRWAGQRGNWWAVGVGLGLFVAGFGVFSVAWYLGQWRKDVPGFWDYRSPTIGDGVLLPVAAALLVVAGNSLPAVPREKLVAVVAGAVGLATGMLEQFV